MHHLQVSQKPIAVKHQRIPVNESYSRLYIQRVITECGKIQIMKSRIFNQQDNYNSKIQQVQTFSNTAVECNNEHSLSFSVLTAIFQVNLGQPVFIEAKDDGGGGDNWTTGAISRAKLHSNHHHQHPVFTGRMLFLLPNQQCQSTEGKNITFHGLAYPKLTCGLPTLSLTTNSSWLPWGRVAMPLISPLMPLTTNIVNH